MMIIKHAIHSLEMNKILKSIPYKIYCAGILLIVIMISFFVIINKFVYYEKNAKFYIQNVMHNSTQAMIYVDSTYVNYFHEGDEYLLKLEHIENEIFNKMKAKVLQNDLSGNIRLELSENCDTSLLFLYGTCKPYVEVSIGYKKLIDVIRMGPSL